MKPRQHRGWSYLLVALQLSTFLLLFREGDVIPSHPVSLTLQLLGVLVGASGIWVMSRSKINVMPEVREGASLVEHGPYRWIRHPMYASVLMIATAKVLDGISGIQIALLAALAGVLALKILREEALLRESFPGYRDYQARTARLIPFVF